MAGNQLTISFHNIGPHADLSLSFSPGVSVLHGRNGIGKSQAISATVAALGGDGQPVSVLDGKLKGTVSVDGVLVLNIGKTVNRKGQPSVEIGSFSAISDMIDPGVIDLVKADSRRVKAILSMAPVPLNAEVIQVLTSGDDRLLARPPAVDAPNILAVAEHFRNVANELALAEERKADVARARTDASSAALAELPSSESAMPYEMAVLVVAQADRKLSQVSLLAAQRAEMIARHERIRATLAEMPDASEHGPAATKLRQLKETRRAAMNAVAELRAALNAAESDLKGVLAQEEAAKIAFEEVAKAADQWKIHTAALQEPITGPVEEDVVAAQRSLEAAQKEAHAAKIKADRDLLQEQIGNLMVEADAAAEHCKELRTLAHDVSTRLGEILAKHGLDGFDVEDGRLYATVDGKRQLFKERLSFGQQAKLALSLACRSFKSRLIPMQPEFWAALQPKSQRELVRLAVEMGCYLITEAPNDDDVISVESLS